MPVLTEVLLKQVAHSLSLQGNVNLVGVSEPIRLEGWTSDSNIFIKREFFRLNQSPLDSFVLRYDEAHIARQPFIKKIKVLKHGAVVNLYTEWRLMLDNQLRGHAFTISFLQDLDNLHIIFSDRGARVLKRASLENRTPTEKEILTASTAVFSCKTTDKNISYLLEKIYQTCEAKGLNQDTMLDSFKRLFTDPILVQNFNPELSKHLTKSFQKVGNCSVANQNINWHLALAGKLMAADPSLSFKEAYEKTRDQYHQLRQTSRLDNLKLLFDNFNDFAGDSGVMMISQALQKAYERSFKRKKYYNFESVLKSLMHNPKYITILKKIALEDSKYFHPRAFLRDIISAVEKSPEKINEVIETNCSESKIGLNHLRYTEYLTNSNPDVTLTFTDIIYLVKKTHASDLFDIENTQNNIIKTIKTSDEFTEIYNHIPARLKDKYLQLALNKFLKDFIPIDFKPLNATEISNTLNSPDAISYIQHFISMGFVEQIAQLAPSSREAFMAVPSAAQIIEAFVKNQIDLSLKTKIEPELKKLATIIIKLQLFQDNDKLLETIFMSDGGKLLADIIQNNKPLITELLESPRTGTATQNMFTALLKANSAVLLNPGMSKSEIKTFVDSLQKTLELQQKLAHITNEPNLTPQQKVISILSKYLSESREITTSRNSGNIEALRNILTIIKPDDSITELDAKINNCLATANLQVGQHLYSYLSVINAIAEDAKHEDALEKATSSKPVTVLRTLREQEPDKQKSIDVFNTEPVTNEQTSPRRSRSNATRLWATPSVDKQTTIAATTTPHSDETVIPGQLVKPER